MNKKEVIKIKKELESHILECNDILSLLDTAPVTEELKLKIKKVSDLIKLKGNQLLTRQEEEQKFVDLIDCIPSMAIQGYNKNREVIYWNKSSENIYGYTSSEAMGKKLEDLIIPDEMKERVVADIKGWYEKNKVIPAGELMLERKDKTPAHVFSSHVMLGAGSANPEMFCVDVDLSEIAFLRVKNKHLEKKVNKDKLTGVYNRHYFESVIEHKTDQRESENKPLSLIMFDIDFFKQINDSYGHDIGDKSLIVLTEIIKEFIRDGDIFVRWGGEEFMLLIETNFHHAVDIAHKLRKSIEVKTSELIAIPNFTCSFGVVDILTYNSFQEAYEGVDEKLYLAKNNGRNRVEF